jgi:hypothetical protein
MEKLTCSTSKQRREQIKTGIDELRSALNLPTCISDNLSQLQILHFACKYFLKNKEVANLVDAKVLGKINYKLKKNSNPRNQSYFLR